MTKTSAATNSTAAAFERGFAGMGDAPGMFSSTLWEAWAVGAFMRDMDCDPDAVLIAARGSSYTVESFSGRFRYTIKYPGAGRYEITSQEI
jgi:hypothetical protein